MKPTDRQSLLNAYKQVLSSRALIKENEEPLETKEEEVTSEEEPLTEEDLDNTEESLVQDIKEFLEDAFTVETFEEAGVMTNNKGLVVSTASGKQFQLNIVRSK
jgi:phage repressor protein C with HTH and peptisase S24 domain